MIGTRVTLRYAKALFEAAQDDKILAEVEADLNLIYRVVEESPKLRSVLESPVTPAGKKKELFDALFSASCQKLTIHFLYLLLEKGRENFLGIIIERFRDRMDAENGIVRGKLISATPVKEGQLKQLSKKIDAITGKKIILAPEVDEKLLGGFVIRLQDTVIDSSIQNQLSRLHKEMLEAS